MQEEGMAWWGRREKRRRGRAWREGGRECWREGLRREGRREIRAGGAGRGGRREGRETPMLSARRVAAFSPLANSPPAISPAANGPPAKSPPAAAIRPPLALNSSTASCTVAPSGVIPYRRVPLGRVRL